MRNPDAEEINVYAKGACRRKRRKWKGGDREGLLALVEEIRMLMGKRS
jgi:hypothetical protein